MKTNTEKNNLLLPNFKPPKKTYISWAFIESSSAKNLLGIQIDPGLTFDNHVSSICNKVGKK